MVAPNGTVALFARGADNKAMLRRPLRIVGILLLLAVGATIDATVLVNSLHVPIATLLEAAWPGLG